jgi:CRISPR/Cas system-associated exonuclease Cas4 (RecB family)
VTQAWSYSRLSTYEQCPRKYWHESVAKTIPFEKTEEMRYGDEWHKAAELFVRDGKQLPLHMRHWQPTLQQLRDAPGEKIVEQQIALNQQWVPVEWFAKDAWLRVKSDLTIINGKEAVQFDYKTGKPKDDFTQLRLNSAVTFHLAPEVEKIKHAFLWTKTKSTTSEVMTKDQVPDFWAEMLPRVARYQEAHDQQNFPPRQGFLCRGWCKVKQCQFWEPKR